jgi:hypothetical protein
MSIKSTALIRQIRQAQQLGQTILDISGMADLNVSYVFATEQTLVINCQDYQSAWQMDEGQIALWQAIQQLGLSIQGIWVEKDARLFCEF